MDTRDVRFGPKRTLFCTAECPLSEAERTFWLQNDTQAPQVANCHFLSAIGGKADIARAPQNVRF